MKTSEIGKAAEIRDAEFGNDFGFDNFKEDFDCHEHNAVTWVLAEMFAAPDRTTAAFHNLVDNTCEGLFDICRSLNLRSEYSRAREAAWVAKCSA